MAIQGCSQERGQATFAGAEPRGEVMPAFIGEPAVRRC